MMMMRNSGTVEYWSHSRSKLESSGAEELPDQSEASVRVTFSQDQSEASITWQTWCHVPGAVDTLFMRLIAVMLKIAVDEGPMRGKYWEYLPMRSEHYLCMKDTVLKRKLESSTQ